MSAAETLLRSGLARPEPADLRTPDGARIIFLHAGQLFVSAEPAQVTTILGSCVAVCLFDAVARVGGVNHYMLPNDVGPNTATLRYANFAMTKLVQDVLAAGAQRQRLQAKIFGGACVLNTFRAGTGTDLGAHNVDVARARLAAEGIPVVAEDVEGRSGRKLIFRTDGGAAMVKKV